MLTTCIEIFKKTDMLKQVLDTYIPADGDYLIMQYADGDFQLKDHITVKMDKKSRTLNISPSEKRQIAEWDYYCKLLEMNKPIDPKKVIHSNNYLSFWIKKESLENGKLTDEVIDRYYAILSNPVQKYKNAKDRQLYEHAEEKLGVVNQEALERIKNWIKVHIRKLPVEVTGKDYLKIFFLMPDTDVKVEGERYFIPNLFNKNDYNVAIGETIYGVPNNNMQMNAKKPFLEGKDRLYKVPLLQSSEDALQKKLFFDYLMNCAASGRNNVYLYSEHEEEGDYKIRSYSNKELPEIKNGHGIYLRIRKDTNEAAIEQMDRITNYQQKLARPFTVRNVTGIDTEKLKYPLYARYTSLKEVSEMIDTIYFSRYLGNQYFTEPKDIAGLTGKRKMLLLLGRNALFNWFYKGNEQMIRSLWNRLSWQLIQVSVEEENMIAVNHQFNVWIAIKEYFEGGNGNMADIMIAVRESIRSKINAESESYQSIESDEEYYYAAGQLAAFFLSRSRTKKRNHSIFNAFLNCKNDKLLKEKLQILFKKYNHDIEAKSKRFNHLYNMVVSYQPDGEVLQNYMTAGYISYNLIYEKGDNKDE